MGCPIRWMDIIQELYTGTECHVRTADSVSEDFQVKMGVRQGFVLSPLLFNCVMDRILKEATDLLGGGLHNKYTSVGGLFLSYQSITTASTCILNVLHTDYVILVAETRRELQHMLDIVDRACARWGMQISMSKTKIHAVEEQTTDQWTTNHPSIHHTAGATAGENRAPNAMRWGRVSR